MCGMRKILLTSSDDLSRIIDLLPSNKGRQSLVTSLIKAYKLNQLASEIIKVHKVTRRDLELYHDSGFVKQLLIPREELDQSIEEYRTVKQLVKKAVFGDFPDLSSKSLPEDVSDEEEDDEDESDEGDDESKEEDNEDDESTVYTKDLFYGLSHDCYPFPFMKIHVNLTAASSIAAAHALIRESSTETQPIAINWYGGRHHCTKRKAAGFCYVNDIILAIGILRKRFSKVFYLDLDLHHGDGVERGYEFSKKVATCSIHRYDIGFYPGTGSLESSSDCKYNIPTHRGLGDAGMLFIIREIVVPLIENFEPKCIVIQAGCDGLGTDEHNEWNMTFEGYWKAIELIIETFNLPVVVLGGGGYNHTETAKCWTYLTAQLLNQDTNTWDIIPEHRYLDQYEKDGYQFWTDENSHPKKMKDENDDNYLQSLKSYLLSIKRAD